MKLIDGKKVANRLLKILEKQIRAQQIVPCLAVILVGNNSSSDLYVRNKKRAAEKIGVKFELYRFSADDTDNKKIIAQIKKMNKRKDVNGIIVQLPLPKKLDADKIIKAINPKKDVDGFHTKNTKLISPVAQTVIGLLEETGKKLKGKSAVVFVKSKVFAEPIKKFLKKKGLKVQIILNPSQLKIKKFAAKSDVVVIALGEPGILKTNALKNNAIIIDVGITPISPPASRSEIGGVISPRLTPTGSVGGGGLKFVGDFDPIGSKKKKGFYTPVPGGVGPVTVAMLLKNVVEADKRG